MFVWSHVYCVDLFFRFDLIRLVLFVSSSFGSCVLFCNLSCFVLVFCFEVH